MIVKRSANGVVTRLNDIARIEIDAAEFGLRSLLDNKAAVAIPIFQAPGSCWIAVTTSCGERPRSAIFCGFSQTRIA
jgi:multidrug efflux pump subunit AcrB